MPVWERRLATTDAVISALGADRLSGRFLVPTVCGPGTGFPFDYGECEGGLEGRQPAAKPHIVAPHSTEDDAHPFLCQGKAGALGSEWRRLYPPAPLCACTALFKHGVGVEPLLLGFSGLLVLWS